MPDLIEPLLDPITAGACMMITCSPIFLALVLVYRAMFRPPFKTTDDDRATAKEVREAPDLEKAARIVADYRWRYQTKKPKGPHHPPT